MRTRPNGWTVLLVAGILLFAGSPVDAQVIVTGALRGRVVDQGDAPVRAMRVFVADAGAGLEWVGATTSGGEFHFPFIPTGEYDITVERLGYAPRRVTGVPVSAGAEQQVLIRVHAVEMPAAQIETEPFHGTAGGTVDVHAQTVSPRAARLIPGPDWSLSELTRLSSVWDDDLGAEGLPGWLSSVRYDGVELPSHGPQALQSPLAARSSVRAAELLTGPLDVTWGGAAGGIVSGHAQRGAQQTLLRARGTWSGDALGSSSIEPAAGYTDLRGEASVRGGLGTRGSYAVGIDVRSTAQPLTAIWDPAPTTDALIGYASAQGFDLAGFTAPSVREGDAVHATAALDLALGASHALGTRLLVSSSAQQPAAFGGATPEADERTDVVGVAHLRSRLGSRTWNQLQIGVGSSTQERTLLDLAALVLSDAGITTPAPPGPTSSRHLSLEAYDAIDLALGAHGVKLGGGARIGSYDYQGLRNEAGVYTFGGIAQLEAGTGALVRYENPGQAADWTGTEFSLFAQDRWQASPALELLLGLRLDYESLPRDGVGLDMQWYELTGVANNRPEATRFRASPRAGIRWLPGGGLWSIEAAAGIHYDRFDPLLLAEWRSDHGSARVRRTVGPLAWPPDGTAGGTSTIHLTVLGPEFNAPRTLRASGSLTRSIGETSVQVAGTVRRTDNLPRRTDLNLTPEPSAQDQHGRPLFGTLVKQGALLSAEPGTSRRFPEYDEVAALSADGESRYWGVTLSVEHRIPGNGQLFARYTHSSTRDDWFAARQAGWSIARPDLSDEGWVDATSDFDVPHRMIAGAAVDAPFGLQLGALYRLQSGLPFTPGFRAGVDANADGVAYNDPAFIDPTIPGIEGLMSAWSCLGESSNAIVERNACRADMVHTVDALAAMRLFRAGDLAVSVLVEAFDLLDREREVPDAALYLIDAGQPLSVDGNVVTVPFVVNPDFGESIASARSGRMVRVGFSLNW